MTTSSARWAPRAKTATIPLVPSQGGQVNAEQETAAVPELMIAGFVIVLLGVRLQTPNRRQAMPSSFMACQSAAVGLATVPNR